MNLSPTPTDPARRGPTRTGPTRTGQVVEFDAERGLGVVEDDDGTRHGFHCTRILDGSRQVPVGARVRFAVVPAALGRWEADPVEVITSE